MPTTATGTAAGTGGQAATTGAGTGQNVTFTDPQNAPTYLGADGQQHHYIGADAQGNYIPDPNYPPAAGGAGTGNTPATAGAGSFAPSQGLVSSLGPLFGNLKTGTAIMLGTLAVLGVALEIITVGTAVFWLAAFLALDIGLGYLSQAAQQVENFFGGDPNEPGISPITKLARQVAQALGVGGLMGDFVITAAIGGAIYYFSRSGGQTSLRIVQARPRSRRNPPMKRVGPKLRKKKK